MDTIKVLIGREISGNAIYQDYTRPVEFTGEELARITDYGEGRSGGITDTRGVTYTLYKAEDGRLLVHIEDWSRWQGEPNDYSLQEVQDADLQPGGEFERLGREAGFGRPLTLDEALGNV